MNRLNEMTAAAVSARGVVSASEMDAAASRAAGVDGVQLASEITGKAHVTERSDLRDHEPKHCCAEVRRWKWNTC